MIAKKNSRYDLERKRTALFTVGLLTSGSLTLAAFTWTSSIKTEIEKEAVRSESISYLVDYKDKPKEEPKLIQHVQRVPEPVQPQTTTIDVRSAVNENLQTVNNTTNVVNSTVSIDGVGLPFGNNSNDIVAVTGEIIEIPDTEASYVGGYVEMQKFIAQNFKFDQRDLEFGETGGKVFLSFVVETDGSISNIKIERGVSAAIDREAKRVVHSFPTWIPGEVKLEKVRTRVRLPINVTFE